MMLNSLLLIFRHFSLVLYWVHSAVTEQPNRMHIRMRLSVVQLARNGTTFPKNISEAVLWLACIHIK